MPRNGEERYFAPTPASEIERLSCKMFIDIYDSGVM
jgi:hypothetical protein